MKGNETNIDSTKAHTMLEKVGLTETESRIYLAGLPRETITVQELLTSTGIKRPTIYHALHTLGEKGLVVERARSAFSMEAPARLLGWLDAQKSAITQKEDSVQSLISILADRTSSSTSSSEITHYADAKSVQAVFDLAFYARSKRCVIITPSKEFLSALDADETRMIDAKQRGVEVKLLIKKIESALIVYDDTIVLLSSASNATVLSSPSLASILSSLL